MKKKLYSGIYVGERALYNTVDALIKESTFMDGESPLKESKNIEVSHSVFKWKYPLWYCHNVKVRDTTFVEEARSGIWYTHNIHMENCHISAPKQFRKSSFITLKNCCLPNALETMWNCHDIELDNVNASGDYFGLNAVNVKVKNFNLIGNYAFDGGKNIEIRNSKLDSKDSFWNCENVTVIDSIIVGEYLGWNSKNLTFINCTIQSHQGMCYIDGLKMINCKLLNTDLCFEFCHNVETDITTHIDSIKNPYDGYIKAKSVGEIILDDKFIDPTKVKIEVKE